MRGTNSPVITVAYLISARWAMTVRLVQPVLNTLSVVAAVAERPLSIVLLAGGR